MKIIGISGKAGNGKDTIADWLVKNHGYKKFSFAGPLKEYTKKYFGFNDAEIAEKPEYVRRTLQGLGLFARNEISQDFWIRKLFDNIALSDKIVVPDVRFLNEAKIIKCWHGKLIRVIRPNFSPINQHISETALDKFNDFDYTIFNRGTIENLHGTLNVMNEVWK